MSARNAMLASHQRLAARLDAILVEGAGSPAGINLRHNDTERLCELLLSAEVPA